MEQSKGLNDLQLELLKIFSFDISNEQVTDIKSLLVTYFNHKISNELDDLFEKNNWGVEKIDEWSKEHMRAKIDKK